MNSKKHTTQLVLFMCICFLVAVDGRAAEVAEVTTWRILGPAASWHKEEEGAEVVAPARVQTSCVPVAIEGSELRGLQCRDVVIAEKTQWSQFNPAIGVERVTRAPGENASTRIFGQVVRDSYARWGAMAGAGRTWTIFTSAGLSLEAGLIGGVWYRATAITSSEQRQARIYEADGSIADAGEVYTIKKTRLERRLVPFVLPLLSVEHTQSGVALNFSVLPRARVNGRLVVPTTTILIQTSFPL